MINGLVYVQSAIFLILAVIHVNWGFGGTYGFEKALPTTEDGTKVLNPTKRDSFIVGLGLILFAVFYLIKIDIILLDLPQWVVTLAGWLIPIIFLLRALGDFKYVGFFKKVRSTDFGKRDSKLYAPLCLFLGINGLILEWNL